MSGPQDAPTGALRVISRTPPAGNGAGSNRFVRGRTAGQAENLAGDGPTARRGHDTQHMTTVSLIARHTAGIDCTGHGGTCP